MPSAPATAAASVAAAGAAAAAAGSTLASRAVTSPPSPAAAAAAASTDELCSAPPAPADPPAPAAVVAIALGASCAIAGITLPSRLASALGCPCAIAGTLPSRLCCCMRLVRYSLSLLPALAAESLAFSAASWRAWYTCARSVIGRCWWVLVGDGAPAVNGWVVFFWGSFLSHRWHSRLRSSLLPDTGRSKPRRTCAHGCSWPHMQHSRNSGLRSLPIHTDALCTPCRDRTKGAGLTCDTAETAASAAAAPLLATSTLLRMSDSWASTSCGSTPVVGVGSRCSTDQGRYALGAGQVYVLPAESRGTAPTLPQVVQMICRWRMHWAGKARVCTGQARQGYALGRPTSSYTRSLCPCPRRFIRAICHLQTHLKSNPISTNHLNHLPTNRLSKVTAQPLNQPTVG